MDKAQKYTDKAIAQIEKLRNTYDSKPLLLSSFQVLLMEHIVQCRLVTGNKGGAIQEIGNLCRLLQSNQILLQRHRAQLHTMLGLYAMSMNCMEAAENQFNAALRVHISALLFRVGAFNLFLCRHLKKGSCGPLPILTWPLCTCARGAKQTLWLSWTGYRRKDSLHNRTVSKLPPITFKAFKNFLLQNTTMQSK